MKWTLEQQQKKKKKWLIFKIYVAAAEVLPSLKSLEVTHPTHHGRRPLWSIAAPQQANHANRRQTGPQKSIRSSHHRTFHQFSTSQRSRE